ncbi:MAG: 30S ribosomal protein S7 [Candidatus Jacksonbacteria bacterium]|jgi:small subunit ribosomal protein S7|nr:30S ribosomal protein S7 [Candidatus Jacksonbacteria bacterium]MBT6034111.1 30S ribosomal protein S7 [Candidatus Jacksonbacteria bacterium]MBT6301219.1 30S ribosomal protein S7 [Candidatus Jacksonbacteria bacterium]MBT6757665.1 30S ribosomal protein S7 [Candidatus Jacksonbacteria bacterium]MBT6955389.1 30S ribosomal protein S7 [Candidatus Jacksonbacteria bacterium]
MRGKQAPQRVIKPDPKYQSTTIAKFINLVMHDGKKSIAQKIVYDAFEAIREETDQDPLGVFNKAIKNVAPMIEVRSRRVGGANYQIPMQVRGDRRMALAYRWILTAARARKGKPMRNKLADELLAASQNQGEAVKKRDDIHRMAEANRAFAHFGR